jgi:hypothetical protein
MARRFVFQLQFGMEGVVYSAHRRLFFLSEGVEKKGRGYVGLEKNV